MRETTLLPYEQMKSHYFSGWHTWNVYSTLSHVLMPYGFALTLCIKEYRDGGYLREAFIGRQTKGAEEVFPLAHSNDYTALQIRWRGLEFSVETAQNNEEFVMLVTPHKQQLYPAMLVLESGFLWNRSGSIKHSNNELNVWCDGEKSFCVRSAGERAGFDANLPTDCPYLTLSMAQTAIFYVGDFLSAEQATAFVAKKK